VTDITFFFFKGSKMRQKKSPTAITTNEEMTYFLLDSDDALKEITKTTREVNEILGLPSTTLVRLILNYFRWDTNTLTGTSFFNFNILIKIISSFRSFLRRSR
jgi:hypothetical protein